MKDAKINSSKKEQMKFEIGKHIKKLGDGISSSHRYLRQNQNGWFRSYHERQIALKGKKETFLRALVSHLDNPKEKLSLTVKIYDDVLTSNTRNLYDLCQAFGLVDKDFINLVHSTQGLQFSFERGLFKPRRSDSENEAKADPSQISASAPPSAGT